MRTWGAALVTGVLLAGCSGALVTPPPLGPSTRPNPPSPLGTDRAESATLRPTVAASPLSSDSPASATAWEMVATFDVSPATAYVTDVVAWSGGFVAIGSSWESAFQVAPEKPAVWASPDGVAWLPQPVELGVESVTLVGIAARADGKLLLIGVVPGFGGASGEVAPRTAAWLSQDAVRWEPIELPLSDGARADALAHGPQGYVLSAQTPYLEFDPNADPTPGELWFSEDAITWTKTYEGAAGVVAGDDGFVAIRSPLAAGPSAVVASADGQAWIESEPVGAPLLDIAALGGDWLATAYTSDPTTIRVLYSANGLDWTPVLDVNDLTGPDGPKTGRGLNEPAINSAVLAGGGGYAFLMLGNNHCCAQVGWTYGVWVTTDGVAWREAIPGNAFVSSVAVGAGVTVLGGHLGRGEDATFWLAE